MRQGDIKQIIRAHRPLNRWARLAHSARVKAGLSQAALAERMGEPDRYSVAFVEQGRIPPDREWYERVALAVGEETENHAV